MLVTLLHCPQSLFGPFHLVYDLAQWPDGTVRSRGWSKALTLYVRYGTAVDALAAEGATRYLCWRYRDWDSLRADEARCGIDADRCRALYRGNWLRTADVRGDPGLLYVDMGVTESGAPALSHPISLP